MIAFAFESPKNEACEVYNTKLFDNPLGNIIADLRNYISKCRIDTRGVELMVALSISYLSPSLIHCGDCLCLYLNSIQFSKSVLLT